MCMCVCEWLGHNNLFNNVEFDYGWKFEDFKTGLVGNVYFEMLADKK